MGPQWGHGWPAPAQAGPLTPTLAAPAVPQPGAQQRQPRTCTPHRQANRQPRGYWQHRSAHKRPHAAAAAGQEGGSTPATQGTAAKRQNRGSGRAPVPQAPAGQPPAGDRPAGGSAAALVGVTQWRDGCWRAEVQLHGEVVSFGKFRTAELAAAAHDAAALGAHGPTVPTNLPVSNYTKKQLVEGAGRLKVKLHSAWKGGRGLHLLAPGIAAAPTAAASPVAASTAAAAAPAATPAAARTAAPAAVPMALAPPREGQGHGQQQRWAAAYSGVVSPSGIGAGGELWRAVMPVPVEGGGYTLTVMGGFSSEKKAARAYDCGALAMHGRSWQMLNFPGRQYERGEVRELAQRLALPLHGDWRRKKKSGQRHEAAAVEAAAIGGAGDGAAAAAGGGAAAAAADGAAAAAGGGAVAAANKAHGVSRHRSRWVASVSHEATKHHVGSFVTMEEAARAFDMAALALRGRHSRWPTNHPLSSYSAQEIVDAAAQRNLPLHPDWGVAAAAAAPAAAAAAAAPAAAVPAGSSDSRDSVSAVPVADDAEGGGAAAAAVNGEAAPAHVPGEAWQHLSLPKTRGITAITVAVTNLLVALRPAGGLLARVGAWLDEVEVVREPSQKRKLRGMYKRLRAHYRERQWELVLQKLQAMGRLADVAAAAAGAAQQRRA